MGNYGIDNIQHLETREAIRARVQMYLGSDDTDGTYQALKEIINNSTDEAIAGYGNRIEITLNEKENCVSVRDYGRGVPFGIKDDKNVLVAIYTESHTGGKFDKNAYKNSSGLNGIGGTAVCMSSEYFTVRSIRSGTCAEAKFTKGTLISYKETSTSEKDGTFVEFKPDKEVFSNMIETYTYKRICEEIKNIAYLNKGLHFIVATVAGEKKEFYSENGIADFIREKAKSPLMSKPILASASNGTDELEIAFIWTKDKTQSYVFVNGLAVPEGGSPVTGAKAKITTKIKSLSGKSFDPELIRKGLVFAINCKVANPSFSNQTKSKINNPNLRTLAAQAFDDGLETFSRTSDFHPIIEMMNRVQKAENAADKAREAILNQNKDIEKALKKKVVLADKLVDCRKHDASSMLFVVEGKSAKGAIVKARNSDTTACFDLRGKLINALKNDDEKLAKNEEVKQLHIAFGCGVGNKFNINRLRYGKIVLVADMDKDGFSINCLILAFLYKFYPQLIAAGKVYWGATPLFKVETKNKTYYAYNEEELKKLPKGDITRLKGLGESKPQDFRDTICSDNPRLIQFTMKDAEAANKYFNILLGEDIKARKEYIFENANFEDLED